MKDKTLGFVFSIFIGICMLTAPVMASEYIGELCFLAEGEESSNNRMMKLGVSHMGDNHFQIAGTWNWEDGSGESTPINGNLEVIDNNFEVTYTFAFYRSNGFYHRIGHLELDTSSLSGNLKMMTVKKNIETGDTSHGVSKMPVSLVPCP